jgi:V8-like Glu-specific endopeptidase
MMALLPPSNTRRENVKQIILSCVLACVAPASAALAASPKAERKADTLSPDAILGELRARQAKDSPKYKDVADPVPGLAQVPDEKLGETYNLQLKRIYGSDNREDLYTFAANAPLWDTADGVVSLFEADSVKGNSVESDGNPLSGTSTLLTQLFGVKYKLCPGERFGEQPSGSYCSGALVGEDLVLTAGHCIGNARFPLDKVRFVFGYRMTDPATAHTRIPNQDIYAAASLVGRVETGTSDWALVRLDRRVSGHHALPVARYDLENPDPTLRRVADLTPVFMIGHPSGLPAKHSGKATVKGNSNKAYFVADLDAYGGSGGSPVFANLQGRNEIVGILVRDLNDFDFVRSGDCYIPVRYRDNQAGEVVTRTSEFTSQLP